MKKLFILALRCLLLTSLVIALTSCKNIQPDNSPEDNSLNKEEDIETINTIKENNNTRDKDDNKMITYDYDYLLEIDASSSYDISPTLYGLFLEDINFAVDGGIYAEKIKNRSFEYGSMATKNKKHGWSSLGEVEFEVINGLEDDSALNQNNPHYATITNSLNSLAGIGNEGFLDGLSIEENAVYNFSGYFKSTNYRGEILLSLQDDLGNSYGQGKISGITDNWQKFETQLTSSQTITRGLKFYVLIDKGTVDMDMISLIPQDTYKGRTNGIRKDIGEMLEELSPQFLRFPGGCIVEGKTLKSAYDWKDSIGNGLAFDINGRTTYGDVATRPLGVNLWGSSQASKHPYYMTYGIGFYEFFLLCEDLGAEPVPIVNAGMSCQIQGTRRVGTPAESFEIGTDEFQQYIQDALDLVEFAKGGADTKWGAIRIAMGHTDPFNLRYVGIGNEQWGEVYFSRYEAFKSAFEEAAINNPELYGDIELIVSNGPVAGDRYAWNKIATKGKDYVGLVDEHYYMEASWFLTNTNRYDSYDRNSVPVFLGEYAAKANTAEAALAEAAYMTGLERNGDVVALASYAPLFGNSTSIQWSPDLIWFNNHTVWGSPNYYVQKIFSNNVCSKILATSFTGESLTSESISGKIGVGTWMTSAIFDNISVVDNETKEVLFSDDFTDNTLENWEQVAGSWSIKDNQLIQSYTGNPINTLTGDVAYIGDEKWENYTLKLTATKTAGSEGFLIPIAVKDRQNSYHWNIGGWGNTVSCLERISAGSKSGQIGSTVRNMRVETNKPYEIKIIVNENLIECYLDDTKMISYKIPKAESLYQVTGLDDNGDLIVKMVNVSNETKSIMISTNMDIKEESAKVSLLSAEKPSDINTENEPENVKIQESTTNVGRDFKYEAPKYSVSVIRIPGN
ncbi:MAG: alpha-N-arabinofuranosidase [Clostridiales bacterium]|nr:alpha-N-arabinofuranosidase [Clostridiales bacterium]